jgi:hypothetical protein
MTSSDAFYFAASHFGRYWHIAYFAATQQMVAFGGKADIRELIVCLNFFAKLLQVAVKGAEEKEKSQRDSGSIRQGLGGDKGFVGVPLASIRLAR